MREVIEISSSSDQEKAIHFRQKHFFDERGFIDPYAWTIGHPNHVHYMLKNNGTMIGYAHIQNWPDHRAALRIIVIDPKEQRKGYGAYLMKWCEKILKIRGVKVLHTEAHPKAIQFYKHLGYTNMPFNDPEGHPTDKNDTPMGKRL